MADFPKGRVERFGATGRHPRGKLNDDDEGELRLGITHKGGKVILDFGKPVAWLGLDPSDARSLAAMLNQHADAAG